MKKLIYSFLLLVAFASGVHAAGGGVAWDKFPQHKATDVAALQNGAKLFANYCLNCHSAAYVRYNRLRDIGLTEDQIKENLMFPTDRVGETMKTSLDPRQAKEWFGGLPPDLTLVARSRSAAGQGSGADYLYTYLRTYYRDANQPTGWNNLAYPNVGMPHVMWELQGQRAARFTEQGKGHGGDAQPVFVGFEQITPGTMSSQQFDDAMGDLVAYMQWMAEPMRQQRIRIGVWVLLFLAVFTVIAWRLNAAFWKDIK